MSQQAESETWTVRLIHRSSISEQRAAQPRPVSAQLRDPGVGLAPLRFVGKRLGYLLERGEVGLRTVAQLESFGRLPASTSSGC